ncbi:hypothetical protein VN97_g3611 [Penicillium thymicola]|uniref:Uncharacterized protein n=1 Tax=Penicillium thymicola TaxID=293382 RepID=A0AAI9XAN3_PENTH|nr:hypothetical protein VN97_g3611 [Penicillium thymicola]
MNDDIRSMHGGAQHGLRISAFWLLGFGLDLIYPCVCLIWKVPRCVQVPNRKLPGNKLPRTRMSSLPLHSLPLHQPPLPSLIFQSAISHLPISQFSQLLLSQPPCWTGPSLSLLAMALPIECSGARARAHGRPECSFWYGIEDKSINFLAVMRPSRGLSGKGIGSEMTALTGRPVG